jgi:alpha-glucosidase
MAHTGAAAPDPLTLRIACAPGAPAGSASLYEDEGEGFGYEDGVYARRALRCEAGDTTRVHLAAREGTWRPPRERLVVELRGLDAPSSVQVDGADHADWTHDAGVITITLAETADERVLDVR